jgi:ABC-type multidrug transport system fused ATPase/permease subunit
MPTPPSLTLRDYARFLARYLWPRLPLVSALAVTLLASISLQLINPQILRSFIDTAITGQAAGLPMGLANPLTRAALAFIGIAITQQLLIVLVVYLTENLGWAATNDLRSDLARHCLSLDMSFHTSHTPGEMIERIDGDVMALSNFFSQFILQVFGNLLLVAGILLVLLREDWRVSLSLAIFVGLTITVLLRLANIAVSSWEQERQASAGLFGFLEERLSGTEDIRSNNAGSYVLNRFYQLTRELMRKTITAGLKVNILLNTTWVLFAIGNAVAILVSAALFHSNALTLGTVFMIIHYTNMMNWPLERITQQMQDLQRAGASLVRILGVQRIQGRISGEKLFAGELYIPLHGQARLGARPLGVVFNQVTFGYNDEETNQAPGHPGAQDQKPEEIPAAETPKRQSAQAPKDIVLHDITFSLAPGRVLGLLGRTGSGKTTLTRLLFRLYDTDRGEICLSSGGRKTNIRQLAIQELRRRVGMVTQNIQLFHATVRENLTFFDPSIPDEQILEALRSLGLWDWFISLPNGLDSELESGGGGLSAGEAQLLAFTRIFLRDPGLVILDEATSRLDPATEGWIERAVDKLVQNRTAIIVAHRLGTVQRADDILILEDGRILEWGARLELAADPASRFAHLLETGLEEVLV